MVEKKLKPSIDNVCAIIVSYCGGERLRKSIKALLNCVDYIIIVDNGSTMQTIKTIKELIVLEQVSALFLHKNMGLGFALNCGVRYARSVGAEWILTLDQDSTIHPDMMQAYSKAIHQDRNLKCLSPILLDHNKSCLDFTDKNLDFAITSGNLISFDVIDDIGYFDEKMFIDGIDIDWSLRVRRSGYRIKRIGQAIMLHEIGELHSSEGLLSRFYYKHSQDRRYYMMRNHVVLMRKYLKAFPIFMVKATICQLLYMISVLYYEGNLKSNLCIFRSGVKDGLLDLVGVRKR